MVARILWKLGHGSARDVHEALPARKRLDYSTVQTYLHRLEEKGYVTSRIEGRAKQFTPRVSPVHVIREAVDDFVKRLFDGNSLPLLQHLIEERNISSDDLQALRSMLDEHEKTEDAT